MQRFGLIALLVLVAGCPRPRVVQPPPPHAEPESPHAAASCPIGPQPDGTQCGSEWWPIKVGCDAEALAINLSAPTLTTIAELRALPRPKHLRRQRSRMQPTETMLLRLADVLLVEARAEGDGDLHLVVADPADPALTMIVEIPAPACVPAGAWHERVARVRDAFNARRGPSGARADGNVVTIEGIGFFDKPHAGGTASNGIELHPVLGVCFGPACDSAK